MHAADPTVYFCDAAEHFIGVRSGASHQVLAGSPGAPGSINASCRKARFHGPRALAPDPGRRVLYIADTGNQAVRVLDLTVLIVNTLIDHHDARDAAGVPEFTPGGIAFDGDAMLAIADIKNHILWAYDLAAHHLRLLAGTPGQHGLTDGDGALARFWLPTAVSLADDGSGFLVAEAGNRQRRLVTRDGRVRTLTR